MQIPRSLILLAQAASLLVAAALPALSAAQQAAVPASPQTQQGPALKPPSERQHLNELAHKLLAAAVKVNGPISQAKPWHIKIDFDMYPLPETTNQASSGGGGGRRRGGGGQDAAGTVKMLHGTAEEWLAERYRWSRVYASDQPGWTGSEWRAGRTELYLLKPKHSDFVAEYLQKNVTLPVIDPLWQVAAMPPDSQLSFSRLEQDGERFNCVVLTQPVALVNPEWLMPTLCFDNDFRLRLAENSWRVVQYEDFHPFEGRSVARTVRVLANGEPVAVMKVAQLESFDAAESTLKPAAGAVLQPYSLEPGDSKPESTYEMGVVIPLMDNHQPFRGVLPVHILVRKDGSVKVLNVQGGMFMQDITDAVNNAVSRWKYKPYQIDGQPTDVQFTIMYVVDGKPFVPSYQRASRAQESNTP